MARAILQVPVANANAVLPDMELLHEMVDAKPRNGSGFSLIGQVPYSALCLALVDTSQAQLDTMVRSGGYKYWESVAGTTAGWPAATDSKAKAMTTCGVSSTEYTRAKTQALAMAVEAK